MIFNPYLWLKSLSYCVFKTCVRITCFCSFCVCGRHGLTKRQTQWPGNQRQLPDQWTHWWECQMSFYLKCITDLYLYDSDLKFLQVFLLISHLSKQEGRGALTLWLYWGGQHVSGDIQVAVVGFRGNSQQVAHQRIDVHRLKRPHL